jgi:hypothetical protein
MPNEIYNVSQVVNNSGDFLSFARNVDTYLVTDFSLGFVVLMMVAVVLFLSMLTRGVPARNASMATSFSCALLSIMMRAMGLISDRWWWLTIIIMLVTLALSFFSE